MIQVKDKSFEVFLPHEQLLKRIEAMASQISADYAAKEPLFVVVLNGAFIFAADLFKHITIPCQISFIRVASYHATQSTGKLTELIGLQENIENRHVVIVEDIVDTALTMSQLVAQLATRQPASLEVATLLCKREAMQTQIGLKYVGFDIPDRFVVGYGLDYDGLGRNLRDLYVLSDKS